VVVLGLLLVVLAVGSAVWLVLGTQSINDTIELTAMGVTIKVVPMGLLIAGAAIMLVLLLGLALVRASARRSRRPVREAKAAQRQAELEENIRADERARAEETHQATLTDRDRVREDEFISRQAQRDQDREADFRVRQAQDEQRIRADERARVEQEYRARQEQAQPEDPATADSPASAPDTATASATVPPATTAAAPLAAASAAGPAEHDAGPAGHDTSPEGQPGEPAPAGPHPSQPAESASVAEGDEPRTTVMPDTDGHGSAAQSPGQTPSSEERSHPVDGNGADEADGDTEAEPATRHRTVADRIMGRD
jgi:hypothetical protein